MTCTYTAEFLDLLDVVVKNSGLSALVETIELWQVVYYIEALSVQVGRRDLSSFLSFFPPPPQSLYDSYLGYCLQSQEQD